MLNKVNKASNKHANLLFFNNKFIFNLSKVMPLHIVFADYNKAVDSLWAINKSGDDPKFTNSLKHKYDNATVGCY